MRRTALIALFAVALTAAGSMACSRARPLNQLQFGVWAVEHRLWDEAVYRFKRELEENPRSAAAYNNLAIAYEHRGLWDEARAAYEAALALDPDNASIRENVRHFEESLAGMFGRGGDKADKPGPPAKKQRGPAAPAAPGDGHART